MTTSTDIKHNRAKATADLRAILEALEQGNGSPIEWRDAHWTVRDLVAEIENADLDHEGQVADLIKETRTRLRAMGVAS